MENMTNAPRHKFKVFFALLFLAGLLVLGGVVMWLWNAILPEVTGWRPLHYWQALGLLVLCRILFGGFHFSRRGGGPPAFARRRFQEKFMDMSDEERAAFRARWEEHCKKD